MTLDKKEVKSVLVTGAGGFIGTRLVRVLMSLGWNVLAVRRKANSHNPGSAEYTTGELDHQSENIYVKDILAYDDWEKRLCDVDVVIHLAGLAHRQDKSGKDVMEDYRNANTCTTQILASAAAAAGVKRFILVSTIKIYGEQTQPGQKFDEASPPAPQDPYSVSKYEAEVVLRRISLQTGLESVVIRPPLVYGPGVRGNMKKLVEMIRDNYIVPVPSADNLRSLISVGNITDAICACMESPAASNQTFVVSDGEDVSTRNLVGLIRKSMGRKNVILPLPKILFTVVGKTGDWAQKMTGKPIPFNTVSVTKIQSSLQVDSGKIRATVGWVPTETMAEGIDVMVRSVKAGKAAVKWINIYYLLTAPAAWAIASMIRYDYFNVTGGIIHLIMQLPVVMGSQYLIFWLVGFGAGHGRGPYGYKFGDIVRTALLGAVALSGFLFIINRMHGVSRTAVVAYPVILAGLLSLPALLSGHRRKGGTDASVSDHHPPTGTQCEEYPLNQGYAGVSGAQPAPDAQDGDMTPARSPEVSVVIVNYNAGQLLTECVRSVLQSTVPVETFISDNGSTDGSLEYLWKRHGADSRLKIVENNSNLGFAKANNVVLPGATGKYLLFLNPDCIIETDTLEKMVRLLESNPEAGMAGCLITNLDGSEQTGCRRMVPTPWRTFVRILHLDKLFTGHPKFQSFILSKRPLPAGPINIEALSGAFMFVRREAMEQVGLLDDNYFMHCEDLDWCMRFRKAGWTILFAPDVKIVHIKGSCSHEKPFRVSWHKHKGMIRFYRKFFRHQYPSCLMWVVIASVLARFSLISFVNLFRRTFAKIDNDYIH